MASFEPQISVIVVSYNTRAMTLACLGSVLAGTRAPIELIVIDNASTDGSAAAIAGAFPDVTLIAEGENHGFAGAHRIAVARARAQVLLLLNPDTEVPEGALDRLLAFARRVPEAGIWGGRTVFADGRLNPGSCWGRMTLFSTLCRVLGLSGLLPASELFNSETYGRWPRNRERAVDIVSGCLLMIRRADWDRLGGFDEAFFMYGEDTDLCLRARRLGLRPRITPEVEILHHGGASEAVPADKLVRLLIAKIGLIRRHFHPLTRGAGVSLFRLWPLSRALALAVGGHLLRRPTLVARARVWRAVWRRRAEWWEGVR